MGIDFSHCNAHWAYSGFHRFRTRIAKEIGVDLEKMQGFNRNNPAKGIPFSEIKDDIRWLLDHSDCDGQISAKRCAKVAKRIRELVKDWPDYDYDKLHALELASGMEAAAESGEPLEFT